LIDNAVESSDNDVFESEDEVDASYRSDHLSLEQKIASKKVQGATHRSASMPVDTGDRRSENNDVTQKSKNVQWATHKFRFHALDTDGSSDLLPAAPSFSWKISSFDERVKEAYGERKADELNVAAATPRHIISAESCEAKIQSKLEVNNVPAPRQNDVVSNANGVDVSTAQPNDSFEARLYKNLTTGLLPQRL
jgi:hypothetical protein